MPPSIQSEEFIVVSSDISEYAQNKTSLPPLAAAIDLRGPIGRDGKRTSAGRRSARQDPLDRLRALPEIRPIPWYSGKELPPEKSILSDRVQTRSACLMASRGRINDPPCTHCATGLGRFSICISLDEFLSGACSTCHLAARGNSCSIRLKVASSLKSRGEQQEDRQPTETNTSTHRTSLPSSAQPESVSPAPPEPHNPHQTRRAKEQRRSSPTASTLWTPVEHSNSNLKRKRETLQGTDVWKPYVSPYRPIDPSPRATPTMSRSPNSFTPANAVREEAPLLNYIYRKDAPVNGASQSQDTTRAPNPASSRPAISATQNLSSASFSNEHANHSVRRDASVSMSPSEQLLDQQHVRPPELGGPHNSRRSDRSGASRLPAREVALIDSLPRKKQREIYGIIDGLQSGIKSCLNQAETMQKELDTLRNILGLDTDDNSGQRTS